MAAATCSNSTCNPNRHRNPAFINLQQPYFETLLGRCNSRGQTAGAPIELRGRNQVTGVKTHSDFTTIDVDTPDGPYQIEADYLIACDGARSPIRDMMGLSFDGRVFEDNFLIADVKMKPISQPNAGSGLNHLLNTQANLPCCTNNLTTSGALISNLAGTMIVPKNWTQAHPHPR
ncbi:Hypothetical protein FKW44_004898 [Caligus rogercresseyi]|uniref:FAD-binding domain-containing protein n=1 Tax=Caligus rogercresseyi TaxID=217165 RepID=A0A7T8HMG5_CALRO|nr:Hypothetical protein FKW44_004898 [Caligus rogercresseyi]